MDRFVAFSCLALALLTPPAFATHCTGPTTSEPDLSWDGTYVDHSLAGVVVYQESNGIAGLQRRDFHVDDTCHGMISPDRRVA